MVILALDLAWTGPTGWIVYDSETTDPIVAYGEFKPKIKKALQGARRIETIVRQIHYATLNLIRDHLPNILVYETTDWHQNLHEGNWREVYARERLNQRCLGRAETAIILAANQEGVNVMELGAREAKNEFGAQRKDAVARLVAQEFPHRFRFQLDNGSYLVDVEIGGSISHHISDAAALAMVAARRLILQEKVTHSE